MDPPKLQSTAEQQSFEAEIGKLRLQRTRYRTERDKAQSEVALLQGRLDDAQDKIADLEGALERAHEAATPRRIATVRQAEQIQPEVMSVCLQIGSGIHGN
jgi:chromosome segregation ATPase